MNIKKCKLTVYPAIDKTTRYKDFEFTNVGEMFAAADAMVDLLLYLQDDILVMADSANAFEYGIMVSGSRTYESVERDELEEINEYQKMQNDSSTTPLGCNE